MPNLATFLTRQGAAIAPSTDGRDYHPGDNLTWRLPHDLTHIGIVADRRSVAGVPLIIHYIGEGAREEAASCDRR